MAEVGESGGSVVSLISSGLPSGQRTRFDPDHGTPIIVPLDTVEEVLLK